MTGNIILITNHMTVIMPVSNEIDIERNKRFMKRLAADNTYIIYLQIESGMNYEAKNT